MTRAKDVPMNRDWIKVGDKVFRSGDGRSLTVVKLNAGNTAQCSWVAADGVEHVDTFQTSDLIGR